MISMQEINWNFKRKRNMLLKYSRASKCDVSLPMFCVSSQTVLVYQRSTHIYQCSTHIYQSSTHIYQCSTQIYQAVLISIKAVLISVKQYSYWSKKYSYLSKQYSYLSDSTRLSKQYSYLSDSTCLSKQYSYQSSSTHIDQSSAHHYQSVLISIKAELISICLAGMLDLLQSISAVVEYKFKVKYWMFWCYFEEAVIMATPRWIVIIKNINR